MKKLLTTIILLLITHLGYSQVPSINETKSKGFSYTIENAAKIDKFEEKANEFQKTQPTLSAVDSAKLADLKKELQKAKELLLKNVPIRKRIYESYVKTYDTLVQRVNDSILIYADSLERTNDLKVKRKMQQKINDNKKEIEKLELDRDAELLIVDEFDGVLPTINEKNRARFFQEIYNNDISKTNYLNSFTLSADGKGALAQSEIITDNMWAFRVAFGTMVTTSSGESEESTAQKAQQTTEITSETEQDAFKRLLNGGGNFYLELILPLFVTNPNNGDQVTSYGYASGRGAMDVKGFGENIDTATGNGSFGFNYYLGVSSDSKKFNFFVFGNVNYTFGTDDFYKNLGIQSKQAFVNGKIIVGVTFLNRFKVSAVVNNFGSDEKLRNSKVSVGVQILPGF